MGDLPRALTILKSRQAAQETDREAGMAICRKAFASMNVEEMTKRFARRKEAAIDPRSTPFITLAQQ
ncbi:MAG TPA: hypothetical protein VGG64_27940 [Pirellulales bacterium]